MSDKETEVKVEAATEVAEPAPQAVQPKTLKIAGKEFDISTSEGLIHAQAWGDAIAHLVGKQGNELGDLRKFRAEMKPTEDESALLAKADELRSQGDHRRADELLLGFAKQAKLEAARKLDMEKENARTWNAYFKSRPELTELFDEDTIRSVSETKLDIYDAKDPFAVLDQFWLPKAPKKAKEEKPPVTLSGGQARPVAPEKKVEEAKPVDFEALLDARSLYKSR